MSAQLPRATYADFIAALYSKDRRFEWLNHFFTHPGGDRRQTHVTIANSKDGRLHPISNGSLESALRSRPADVQTRLVILRYGGTWAVDRGVVDTIACVFDLDPIFIWRHFDYESNDIEREAPDYSIFRRGMLRRADLPSDENSIEIGYHNVLHLSAVILEEENDAARTVVMFVRCPAELQSYPPIPRYTVRVGVGSVANIASRPLSVLFEESLFEMNTNRVRSADANPAEFTYPWVRILTKQLASDIQRAITLVAPEILDDLKYMQELDEQLTEASLIKATAMEHLRRISYSSAYAEMKEDLKYIVNRSEHFIQHNTNLLNTRVGFAALKESSKSIELASTVKNFSELTIVFLPLTFVATLFGMNIKELEQGNAPFMAVVLAASFVCGLTFIMWYAFRLRGILRETKHWRDLRRLSRFVWGFCFRTPLHGFWLALFFIVHARDVELISETLRDLRLYTLRGADEYQISDQDRFYRLRERKTPMSRFWLKQVKAMSKFTAVPGWQDRLFYSRFFESTQRDNLA